MQRQKQCTEATTTGLRSLPRKRALLTNVVPQLLARLVLNNGDLRVPLVVDHAVEVDLEGLESLGAISLFVFPNLTQR